MQDKVTSANGNTSIGVRQPRRNIKFKPTYGFLAFGYKNKKVLQLIVVHDFTVIVFWFFISTTHSNTSVLTKGT